MYKNKFRCCRLITITLLASLLNVSSCSAYIPITIEQKFNNRSIVIGLPHNVLETMSKIISRDNKIPISFANKYAKDILDSAIRHSIDPLLIMSVISIESKFNPLARNNGAIGLMQIVSRHHKNKISSPKILLEPSKNIDIGTQILKECFDKSKSEVTALSRYNGSLGVNTRYAKKVLHQRNKYTSELYL